ncbi:hypothetical protein AUR64_12275 [Haloprofundus marisrubri]|uniref:Uncharacterized protein n=1 Tax=Haloprofundus marisrubri TaxID=1514971 RepID=A0A0W1RB56_9EURY|nr:hypothetical protein [Haloprofundus marisrubri]KTG10341.1 hypothetical protein AUR64_12275 [Haloprofundus marisrubri]
MTTSDPTETLAAASGFRPVDAPYVGAALWLLGTLLAGYAGYELLVNQLRYPTLWGVSLGLLVFSVVVLGQHLLRTRY